jgi:hypothetical protein
VKPLVKAAFTVVFTHSFLGGLTSGKRPVVKIIAESFLQHDEKHVEPTPLWCGKRIGRRRGMIVATVGTLKYIHDGHHFSVGV